MAKTKNADALTADEKKDLQSIGWNEADPFHFPENVSPVLKSKVIEQYKKDENLSNPLDMPNAIETGNQASRYRAAADGDKEMQKILGVDENGAEAVAGTAKRQNEAASSTK